MLEIAPGVEVKFCRIGGLTTGLLYWRSEAITYKPYACTYAYARMTWAYGSDGALMFSQ